MKKWIVLCIFTIVYVASGLAIGEGFLPSLDEIFGISIPIADVLLEKEPNKRTDLEDGRCIEEFTDVSFEQYAFLGKCFRKSGFELESSNYTDGVIQLTIQKECTEVGLEYDVKQYSMMIIYPRYYTEDSACCDTGIADISVFPEIEKIAGTMLPRLSVALMREPDLSSNKEAGLLVEEYNDFSEADYETVSQYLLKRGCSVVDYSKIGKVLTISLEKHGTQFAMIYDPEKKKAIVEYNYDSIVEPIVTNTPTPTETPAPTINPNEYNTYAAIFVAIVKGTLKKPDSLDVHSIKVMKYLQDNYIVIDFSGMNSFGGYERCTYSFKFEVGHISLSGNSSDYDQYEKHKEEFSLIATLDVNAVLEIVNK